MKDFIREIWNGRVSPIEDWMEEMEEIKKIERLRARHKEHLMNILSEEDSETLEKLLDCDNEIEWIHNEEAFTSGVRFAVNFLIEALQ